MAVTLENEKQILENFVEQHKKNYKEAVIEVLKNNTHSLINDDIASLIKKPPLDSMDTIKTKLLQLAKKENIVLKSEEMKHLILSYRTSLLESLNVISDIRNSDLVELILEFNMERETQTIEIEKEILEKNNKLIKKEIKKSINDCVKKDLINNIDIIYSDDVEISKRENIKKEFTKYMKNTYQKQLLENIAIKILVKDRTLVNGVSEQGERYLFMKSKSYLLSEKGSVK